MGDAFFEAQMERDRQEAVDPVDEGQQYDEELLMPSEPPSDFPDAVEVDP